MVMLFNSFQSSNTTKAVARLITDLEQVESNQSASNINALKINIQSLPEQLQSSMTFKMVIVTLISLVIVMALVEWMFNLFFQTLANLECEFEKNNKRR